MLSARGKVVLYWALAALWACFIFFMSAHTGQDLSSGNDLVAQVKRWLNGIQKALLGPDVDAVSSIAHFLEYMVFGVLLQTALRQRLDWKRAAIFAIAIASAYGVTDEIHQLFVAGRECDPLDWVVDTCGAAIGAFAWGMLHAGRKPRT